MIYGCWKDVFLYQLSSHNLDMWVITVLIECTFVCVGMCVRLWVLCLLSQQRAHKYEISKRTDDDASNLEGRE